MPQMMPINWLTIFSLNMICLFFMIMLINSFIIFMSVKKSKYSIYKKWTWLW